jgi:hypothetical protein
MPPNRSVEFPEVSDGRTTSFDVVALVKCIIEDGSEIFLEDAVTAFGGTSLPKCQMGGYHRVNR